MKKLNLSELQQVSGGGEIPFIRADIKTIYRGLLEELARMI